jgi:hypothetical protein
MPTKNIVWLASYPKSGNTWVRIFLANYVFAKDEPLSINEVSRLGTGDSLTKHYRAIAKGAFDPRDHTQSIALRGKVLKAITANKADVNLVKTHNIHAKAFGTDLIPAHLTRSAIYIIRNPLDMVMSYARHYGQSLEKAAVSIGRDDNTTVGAEDTVKQYLGNWSKHVRSWTRTRDFPVLVMRYEDMLADPETEFGKLLAHFSFTPDPDKLAKAIRFSSFDEVKAQEEKQPFIERSSNNTAFFHSGKAGAWKDTLPAEVIERISTDHKAVMTEFGYL